MEQAAFHQAKVDRTTDHYLIIGCARSNDNSNSNNNNTNSTTHVYRSARHANLNKLQRSAVEQVRLVATGAATGTPLVAVVQGPHRTVAQYN